MQEARVNNITVDSKGNIYVAEARPTDLDDRAGQRAQKFTMKAPER